MHEWHIPYYIFDIDIYNRRICLVATAMDC